MNLIYTYGGIVENNQDPLKLGRLKVRVPHVYGSAATSGYIGTNDLPWALPAGMPAGSNKQSGGLSHIPEKGDKVWVRFLDGEPEKPIWEWGMQTLKDQEVFHLHSHRVNPNGTVGDPDRAVWTKYAHAIELNAGAVIATTSQGYNLLLTDATAPGTLDGSAKLSTARGQFLSLDDLDSSCLVNVLQDITFVVGGDWTSGAQSYSFEALTGDFEINVGLGALSATATESISFNTATSFNVDALSSVALSAAAGMVLDFATLHLGTGSSEPYVLGNQFKAWIASLFTWLATHVHSSGEVGSPTSPPLLPPYGIIQPDSALLTSQQIYGR